MNRASTAFSRPITASMIRTELGKALSRIRIEDELTWAELGELLNKSDDQAAKYADGSADMPVSTFYRAKGLWNGRFTGLADKLVMGAAEPVSGQRAQSCLAKAQWALSVALEDGELTDAEIRERRSDLEKCRDSIDALLGRLVPRDVA